MRRLDYKEWQLIRDDRLVARWRNINTYEIVSQGKRVANDCPLTKEERRLYVKDGIVPLVKCVRTRLNCDLREALDLINKTRLYEVPK